MTRRRGIVVCAGGHRLLANAYVTLKRLRTLTDLPVELCYAGPQERPPTFTDLPGVTPVELPSELRGFHIKPYALLQSSFEHVLLLDADNLPLQPLEPLFDHDALFWPDLGRWTHDSLYADFGLDPALNLQSPEFESGQIVVHKPTCLEALRAACWLSSAAMRPHVYSKTLGDKDVFRLAFHLTKTPYILNPNLPKRFGAPFFIQKIPGTEIVLKLDHPRGRFYPTGLLQHDLENQPLFAHRTVLEWKPYLDSVAMTHLEGRPDPTLRDLERWGQEQLHEFRRRYRPHFAPDRGEQLQALLRRLVRALLGTRPGSGAGPR